MMVILLMVVSTDSTLCFDFEFDCAVNLCSTLCFDQLDFFFDYARPIFEFFDRK